MQRPKLQAKTKQWINEALHPIAVKMTQQAQDDLTHRDILIDKVDQKIAKAKIKVRSGKAEAYRYIQRLNIRLRDPDDFLDEIRLYLEFGIYELMSEGFTETEAAQKIIERFSSDGDQEADFDKLLGDWSNYYVDKVLLYSDDTKREEAVGLFYAAFLIGFGVAGGLWRYFANHLAVGLIAGPLTGIAMGLLVQAIIILSAAKK